MGRNRNRRGRNARSRKFNQPDGETFASHIGFASPYASARHFLRYKQPSHADFIIASNLCRESVTVLVGPEAKPIATFKELLCRESEYVRTWSKPEWAKEESKSISLPNEDVETVETFIALLYGRMFCEGMPDAVKNDFDAVHKDWILLPLKVYIFTDRLFAREIGGFLLEYIGNRLKPQKTLNERQQDLPPIAVRLAMENLPAGDAVLRAIVEAFCASIWSKSDDINLLDYPKEFLASVVRAALVDHEMSSMATAWSDGQQLKLGWFSDFRKVTYSADERMVGGKPVPCYRPKRIISVKDRNVRVFCKEETQDGDF